MQSILLWFVSWLNASSWVSTSIPVGSGSSYISGGLLDSRSYYGKGFVDTQSRDAKSMGCKVCAEISSGRSSGLLTEERSGSRRLAGCGAIFTNKSVVYWGPEIGENVHSGAKGWRSLRSLSGALEPGEGSSIGGCGTTGNWWAGRSDAVVKCSRRHESLVDKVPRIHGDFPSMGAKAVKVVLQIAMAVWWMGSWNVVLLRMSGGNRNFQLGASVGGKL